MHGTVVPASDETKDRALFRVMKPAVLEHPRHAVLRDGSGTVVARGEQVPISAVLEPVAPGGVVQYTVKLVKEVVGTQGTAAQRCSVAELVVPENWLRPKGTLATSQSADYLPIAEVLEAAARTTGLLIPLFQRRYCWSEQQWEPLWRTVCDLARQGDGAQHSLKRLLCLENSGGSVVLDGQQRLTTCCVLLAALRDATASTDPTVSAAIATLLCLDQPRQDGWRYVVRPTLDDCADFAEAVSVQSEGGSTLPSSDGGIANSSTSGAPLVCCRSFFSARLAALCESGSGGGIDLQTIYAAVTQGLHVLHFPLGTFLLLVFLSPAQRHQLHISNTIYSSGGIGKVTRHGTDHCSCCCCCHCIHGFCSWRCAGAGSV